MMPLLTDSAAARARDAVIAIDAAIRDDESGNDGYAALFSAYVATLVPDGDAQQERMLDRLVERLGQPYARAGLFGGLAGDGWVLCHIGDECEPLLVQIDRQLHAVLPTLADFDLISGSAGIAIYFAERLHQGAEARDALATTFAHLASRWRAAPGDDCGLAHGTPGVIAAATIAAARGIVDAVALRDEALAWLSRARLADGAYPTKLGGRPARTAWCYGDPGIVAALWNAGDDVRREAHERARSIATRSMDDAHVSEAAFCHGASGVAHILHCAYRATGDEVLAAGARTWFERALALPLPTGAELLEGATGLGLALAAAISEEPWGWDRMLACALSSENA